MADDVVIKIVGQDEASGAINKVKSALAGMASVAGGLLLAEGFKTLVGGLQDSMRAAADSQIIEAQTAAAIKSTGDASGMTATQIKSYASALEGTSTFSRDTIQQGENMLLTFTNIGKNTFPAATKAVTDMTASFDAAGKGMNISDIAIMVGKALNDPVKGMTALHRVGVAFTDDQKKLVAELMKTGDVAGAQAVIIGELNREFGGSAAAAAGTYAGQLAIVRNRFQDMKIAVGEALMPILAHLATAVLPLVSAAFEKIPALIERITPALQRMAAYAVLAFQVGMGFVRTTVIPGVERLAALLQGPVHAAFVMVRDAVLTFVQALSGNWTDSSKVEGFHRVIGQIGLTIRDQVIPAVKLLAQFFMTTLWPAIKQVGDFISQHLNIVLPLIGVLLLALLGPVAMIAAAVGALLVAWRTNFLNIQGIVSAVWGVIGPILGAIKDNLDAFGATTLPKLEAAWEAVKTKVEEVVNAIAPIVKAVFDAIASFIQAHGEQIKAILQGAWDVIKGVVEVDVALIEGIIKVALDLISGNWSGAWNDIKATAQSVWDGIKTIVQGAIEIVKNEIQIALDAIKALWTAAWTALNSAVESAWAAVKSSVQGGISAIKGFFADAGSWLVQAGRDIIMGLANGITSAIGGAVSAAANAASSALNAAKAALGIHSPSAAMFQVGLQTVQGLIDGMDAKQQDAAKKAAEVVKGVADAFKALVDLTATFGKTGTSGTIPALDQLKQLSSFGDQLVVLMAGISKQYSDKVLPVIQATASTVKGSVDAFDALFKFLNELGTISKKVDIDSVALPTKDMLKQLAQLGMDMVGLIANITASFSDTLLTSIQTAASSVKAVTDAFGSMLTFLEAIPAFAKSEASLQLPDEFTLDLESLMEDLVGLMTNVTGNFSGPILSAVQAAAGAVSAVITPFKNMMDFLQQIPTFLLTNAPMQLPDEFSLDLESLMEELLSTFTSVTDNFSGAILSAVQTAASAVSAVITPFKDALDFLTQILNFNMTGTELPKPDKMAAYLEQVITTLVTVFSDIAAKFTGPVQDKVKAFANAVKPVFDAIKPFADAIKAMQDMSLLTDKQIKIFHDNMIKALGVVSDLPSAASGPLKQAQAFAATAGAIAAAILNGVAILKNVGIDVTINGVHVPTSGGGGGGGTAAAASGGAHGTNTRTTALPGGSATNVYGSVHVHQQPGATLDQLLRRLR